jgi:hypothetical protein
MVVIVVVEKQYSESVFVASGIQYAMRKRHILTFDPSDSTMFTHIMS